MSVNIFGKIYDTNIEEHFSVYRKKIKDFSKNVNLFRNLKTIQLLYCKIKIIPEDFCNSSIELERIELDNNKISDICNIFCKFTKLRELRLRENRIKKIPFVCKSLEILCLDRNEIEEITESFCGLSKLKVLWLNDNRIQNIPINIYKLINLETLYLRDNEIKKLPNSFSNLINLRHLYLSSNELVDIPENLENLLNLKNLDISDNEITSLPISIINLVQLSNFQYFGNPIENLDPIIQRFLNRLKNKGHNINIIYRDEQNVHALSIEKSIRESILKILSCKYM